MTVTAPAVTAPTCAATSGAPPVTRRSGRELTDYAELLGRVQAHGPLERHCAYYATKIPLLLAAFVAVWCGFFLLGEFWFQRACGMSSTWWARKRAHPTPLGAQPNRQGPGHRTRAVIQCPLVTAHCPRD